MKMRATIFALILIFANGVALAQSDGSHDGEVRKTANSSLESWDSQTSEWISLDEFWERYAARRGGITWGKRTAYPAYERVRELDTLMIELESGQCLMEFFHTRWRRANDVRRWDDAFNEYAGCPYVFDQAR
jgi:hypothetical protein